MLRITLINWSHMLHHFNLFLDLWCFFVLILNIFCTYSPKKIGWRDKKEKTIWIATCSSSAFVPIQEYYKSVKYFFQECPSRRLFASINLTRIFVSKYVYYFMSVLPLIIVYIKNNLQIIMS